MGDSGSSTTAVDVIESFIGPGHISKPPKPGDVRRALGLMSTEQMSKMERDRPKTAEELARDRVRHHDLAVSGTGKITTREYARLLSNDWWSLSTVAPDLVCSGRKCPWSDVPHRQCEFLKELISKKIFVEFADDFDDIVYRAHDSVQEDLGEKDAEHVPTNKDMFACDAAGPDALDFSSDSEDVFSEVPAESSVGVGIKRQRSPDGPSEIDL